MAGDRIYEVVYKWNLDFMCHKAWQEFQENKCLDNQTVDFISGILPKGYDNQDLSYMTKIYFLIILCRMNDGEKLSVRYTEQQEDTPLETMITWFDKLVRCLSGKLLDDGLTIIEHTIKPEAVLVCCRQKDYELASKVYKRQWSKVTSKDERGLVQMKSILKDLINPGSGSSDRFKFFTYANFQTSMINYLDRVQKDFGKPQLIKAAEIHIRNMDRIDKEMDKLPYANKKFGRNDQLTAAIPDDENNNAEDKASKAKQKLRRLWNKQLTEMFGSPIPEIPDKPEQNSNTNSNKRTLGDSGTPEGSRKSSRLTGEPGSQSHTEVREAGDRRRSPAKKPTRQTEKSPQVPDQPVSQVRDSGDRLRSPAKKATRKTEKSPQVPDQPVSQVRDSGDRLRSPAKTPPQTSTLQVSSEKQQTKGFKSPGNGYRKNKDRPNRHDPVNDTRQEEDTESNASSFDLQSVISVSSSRKKWEPEEMMDFYQAVRIHGVGHWAEIREHLGTTRTNVMLKDKWRNMVKSGDAERLEAQIKKAKKKG